MNKYITKYVGMDVHKETIAVAIAREGRGEPIYYGEIPNTDEAIKKLVKKVTSIGEKVSFCYEAGPCGYDVYRQLIDLGQRCDVVAPSLIPKKSGDRVKTDRRDATTLTRLCRAGELTPVWVPERTGSNKGSHPCPRRHESNGRACQTAAWGISLTAWKKISWEVQMDASVF